MSIDISNASTRSGIFGIGDIPKSEISLHPSLVPGSNFDSCEFVDFESDARAMFSDRSDTHSIKVRGPTYLDDNEKVAAGKAMAKLLLLELYEVDQNKVLNIGIYCSDFIEHVVLIICLPFFSLLQTQHLGL